MKVFITGANSMLGCNVVETLHSFGYELVALVRRSNEMLDKTCNVVIGNVNDEQVCRNAMNGCDAVVHIAAITDTNLIKLEEYKFNWSLTQKLASLASEIGIKKFVFISSANSIGNGTIDSPAKENQILLKPYKDLLYGQSKVVAELTLLKEFPNSVILNPTFMIGKYDSKPSSGYLIKTEFKKRFVFISKGGKNFVPAKDVAKGVRLVLENDVSGKFILGGEELTFKKFLVRLSSLYQYKTTIFLLPKWSTRILGKVGDLLRMLGIKVSISSASLGILTQREFYSSQKAKDTFGYTNSDLDVAIKESTDWMVENGVIKKKD